MIRIDHRIGSAELERYFTPYGIKVKKTKLDFGDFDFLGNGPKGKCAVVFERKRIEDLVDSMVSNRLSGHQLPGMAEQYDYAYLIIEGIWRPGLDGSLEVNNSGSWYRRPTHTRAITNYVMGLALRAGLIPWRTGNQQETVSFIVDQYRMWNEKKWNEHTSHNLVYAPADPIAGMRISLVPRKIRLVERMAMQLPGVDRKARKVGEHFKSAVKMTSADEEEWTGIDGIGKKGAARIVAALNGAE